MDEKRGSGASGTPGNSGDTDGAGSESLDARRKRLDTELSARRKVAPEDGSSREASKGYALAVKLSSEFIAGVIVGVLLGYLFDRFLGTSPWGIDCVSAAWLLCRRAERAALHRGGRPAETGNG
jgi:ATP synthase protein I